MSRGCALWGLWTAGQYMPNAYMASQTGDSTPAAPGCGCHKVDNELIEYGGLSRLNSSAVAFRS